MILKVLPVHHSPVTLYKLSLIFLRNCLWCPGTTNAIRQPAQIGKIAKKNELGLGLRPTTTTTLCLWTKQTKKVITSRNRRVQDQNKCTSISASIGAMFSADQSNSSNFSPHLLIRIARLKEDLQWVFRHTDGCGEKTCINRLLKWIR